MELLENLSLEGIEKKYESYFHLIPIAFKGFEYDDVMGRLKCRYEYFDMIEWNEHKDPNSKLELCNGTGYHFCNDIYDVFRFYTVRQNTKFYIIEYDSTRVVHGKDKSITKKFRLLEDISIDCSSNQIFIEQIKDKKRKHQLIWISNNYKLFEDTVNKFIKEEEEKRIAKENQELLAKSKKVVEEEYQKRLKNESLRMADNLKIKFARKIQEKYPNVYIGGSLGLFLHGMRIPRFLNSSSSDIDLIIPYFQLFESSEGFTVKHENAKASGNDFDETFILTTPDGTIKVDIKIDPKHAYEVINFEGVNYKVTKFEKIWEAKIRYGLRGNNKHSDDLKELMLASGKSLVRKDNICIGLPW